MRNRRFVLLTGAIVALNLFLWLASPGLALRRSLTASLFGPKLVRAEVIDSTGGTTTADWRLDRGVVTTASSTQLTLDEADTRVQTIALGPATQVKLPSGRRVTVDRLKAGWRVLVVWPANGTATTVQVERRGHGHRNGRLRLHG